MKEQHNSKFQGGNAPILWNYYNKVLKAMPSVPQTCLNVGSGIALEFEKYLYTHRKGIDQIDCIDRNEPNGGGYYKKFYFTEYRSSF